ncbi:acyl-CoA dehydrogenase family protein [Paracoccus onubensis]|uniref:acyl-CoA dehydrogenase family protein n=1 Tax=Paracoccus onubensis TaxID=1675788 RepID=UPI00273001E1|nr:acyl-CoA dehydrogenase family protein [Paracoccus onubensis]MDP0927383.1 acyl-CoA dehydrogenase family protein [Paracoccus onubensis]
MPAIQPSPHEDLNPLPDQEFRAIIRHWIQENYPEHLRNPQRRLHISEGREWYEALSRQGWLAPNWPREHGGMGLSPSKLLIMIDEQERHGVARLPDQGITMVGPLLIRHGTETQRQYHLPRILSGEIIWCQGYSEPNAGSDLASLQTRAVRDGDDWVINGQKIWTTLGMDADWIYVLARTDTHMAKQKGISFFIMPVATPGIEIRPIRNLDMHDEFCEVFFRDVRIPANSIVGEINSGWSIAKNLLSFERIFLGSPFQATGALDHLARLVEHLGRGSEPRIAALLNELRMELADHQSFYKSFADQVRRGEPLGPDVSMLKINLSVLYQRITDHIIEIAGEHAAVLEPLPDDRSLYPASAFIQARPHSIYGGSSEIQKNIVAKQVLGLGDNIA